MGFHNVIKDVSEAGASIRDYEDILKKELEDSKTGNRVSKKMTELFPNEYKNINDQKCNYSLFLDYNVNPNMQQNMKVCINDNNNDKCYMSNLKFLILKS